MRILPYGSTLLDNPAWGWEPPCKPEDDTEEQIKDELLEGANTFREIMDDVYVSAERETRFNESLYQLFARWNAGGFISHLDGDTRQVTLDWELLDRLNRCMKHIEQALNRVAAERVARRT